ncbi:hypothetical protein A2V71_03780 [Candidatus Berkelbacteria bacterium RBG_13_40_8]|uniref:Uncharacterized protein n=1 Tax=Candidatus Berkelbacteria bacterium RBG_13_40_8 TaxID=1797467 RepID=A0A1F5DN48_9BACT|nr:MAG: hypothetical protein A2V71_03780 [Candidatus Berkelbacteria bacterium RBG_13_40_8]
MKIVADRQETAIAIPIIVKPIEVEVALTIIAVEIDHVAVTVNLAGRTKSNYGELPLKFGVFSPKRQQFRMRCWS